MKDCEEYIRNRFSRDFYWTLHCPSWDKKQKQAKKKKRQKTLFSAEGKVVVLTKESKGKRGETLNHVDTALSIA